MIKKFTHLYWYEKSKKEKKHQTLRKNLKRFQKLGISGVKSGVEKDYKEIEKDYITKSLLNARYAKFKTRLFFIIFFLLGLVYLTFVKSELYESRTDLIVKDLSSTPMASTLGLSLLGMGSSSQLQDSKIVEEYLKSLDVYLLLDAKFQLTKHYKSSNLDFIERLSTNAKMEEVLEFYNNRLLVTYDEVSGILNVAFSHVEREKAKEILEFLVKEAENKVNDLNRQKAKIQLDFVKKEYIVAKKRMDDSSNTLEEYQNSNLLLDPSAEASATGAMISELEATLLKKSLEYSTMKSYLNEDSYELQALSNEIVELKLSIAKERKGLSGKSDNRLNKVLFEYEKLKLKLEFDTEVYKNALIQLETSKVEANKQTKSLSILTKPNLPDGYTYPNKLMVFINLLIVTLLFYGIFSMLHSIIKDHKE